MDVLIEIGYWTVLPQIGAAILQSALYFVMPSMIRLKNTPEYRQHASNCYTAVIILYLIYSTVRRELDMPPNYYEYLKLWPNALPKEIKANFRVQSLTNHPDKNRSLGHQMADDLYVRIGTAHEILKNPIKRMVYDNLGTSVLSCIKCHTYREYLWEYFRGYLVYYITSASTGLALALIGTLSSSFYWRFMTFLFVSMLELYLIVAPADPISWILPWRTVGEKITLLRHLLVIFSIAISRLGPILSSEDSRPTRQLLIELENVISQQIESSKESLSQAVAPFISDGKGPGPLPVLLQRSHLEKSLESDAEYQKAAVAFKARREATDK